MKKKELLAPAGNFESLKYAIRGGADAVYVGGQKFGARAYADNFNKEEMLEAVRYAHLYGVKLYVTVNTIVYENEIKEVLEYVKYLYQIGVDALIMSDIGLIKQVHAHFPLMEIHASTQLNTHNKGQVMFLKEIGVTRVVLSRELTLHEIEACEGIIESEVFIHGALCISYSGQCLFSSVLMNRSGNRGECAQICRLPFELYKQNQKVETAGNYLLSTKELNTSYNFAELMKHDIASFKIEGRMKSPAYVGYITSIYRKLMDAYEAKEVVEVSSEEEKNMQALFSRGFTGGHIFKKNGSDLMNIKTSNHQGTFLGNIVSVNNQYIEIELEDDLVQEDGIRFMEDDKGMIVNFLYDRQKMLIREGKRGQHVFVENRLGVKKTGKVHKTINRTLEKMILAMPEKKIKIRMNAEITKENGFVLSVHDGENEVIVSKPIVFEALNQPTNEEQVEKQLSKLGSTPYHLDSLSISLEDNSFINVREINHIRREAIVKLTALREEGMEDRPINEYAPKFTYKKLETKKVKIDVFAKTEEQLNILKDYDLDLIYVKDKELYEKYHGKIKNLGLRTNRVIKSFPKVEAENILAGENGTVFISKTSNVTADYFVNATNHLTVNHYFEKGKDKVLLSPELNIDQIDDIASSYEVIPPIVVYLYGRLPLMVMNHCIIKNQLGINPCLECKTKSEDYYLVDRNQKRYPIRVNKYHQSEIYHYDILDRRELYEDFKDIGIKYFFLEFFSETKTELIDVMNSLSIKCLESVK